MNMSDDASLVRLNKFLAERMYIGRRQADELIGRGQVSINGETAILGARVDPAADTVAVKGRTLSAAEPTRYRYLALHKPVGYVSSRRQQGGAPA